MKIHKILNAPELVCNDCGEKFGEEICVTADWYIDRCDICSRIIEVTTADYFGGMKKKKWCLFTKKFNRSKKL